MMKDAVEYAADHQVPIVTISHNDAALTLFEGVRYPGALSDEYDNVITVAATDINDEWPVYSNYGDEVVMAAPGGFADNAFLFSNVVGAQVYNYIAEGTSYAAPHVAGVVALMLTINEKLTYSEIRDILEETADEFGQYPYDGDGWNECLGHGRLNAYQALKYTIENHGASLGGPGESVTFNDEFTIEPDVDLTILEGTTFTLQSGSVLNLSSNMVIENGASLVIEEDVAINYMEDDVRIISDGVISATGTSSDRITIDHNGHSGNRIEANRGAQIQHADIIGTRVEVTGTGSHHAFITDTHFKNPPVAPYFSSLQYVDFYENYIDGAGLYFWNQQDINMQANTIENAGIGVSLWNSELAEFHSNVVEGSSSTSMELMFSSEGFLVNLDRDEGYNRLKANEGEQEVYVGSNAQLFIGDQSKPTNNSIFNDDPSHYLIENDNSSHQVEAQHTYWGSSSAPPSYLFYGLVDYSNHNGWDQTGDSGSSLAKTAGSDPQDEPEQQRREMLLELISELDQDVCRQGNDLRLNDLYVYMRMDRDDRMGLRDQILATIDDWSQRRSEITDTCGDSHEFRRAEEAALLLEIRYAFRSHDYEGAETLNRLYHHYIQGVENRVALLENEISLDIYRHDYAAAYETLQQAREMTAREGFDNERSWQGVEDFLREKLGDDDGQGSGYKNIASDEEAAQTETQPEAFALKPNYPNPFNPVTTIPFTMEEPGQVRLEIYDMLGRRMGVLVNGSFDAGRHEARWDGSSAASGVYLVRMTVDALESSHRLQFNRRVMLLK